MKIQLALLSLLALAQALPHRAQLRPEAANLFPNIVGGVESKVGERPFQISLELDGGHVCGGSIVNENWIVTAAHCAVLGSASDYAVRAGIHNIRTPDAGSQYRSVSLNIVHENYDSSRYANDIALMKLSQPLAISRENLTAAIPLAASGRAFSGNLIVSGWGNVESGGSLVPAKLRQVEIPTVSDEICDLSYPDRILDSMICAGLSEGGKDSCQGDSGGPLTGVIDGVTTLVGIVSWGRGCAFEGYPGVNTEVSFFNEWVAKTVAAN